LIWTSGSYGMTDGYALIFDAYRRRPLKLMAVARPHLVAWAGQPVTLDATRSWHADGPKHIRRYEWRFTDGKTATGARATQTYAKPGHYIVTVSRTNNRGQRATGRLHLTVGPRAVRPKPHQLGDPG